MRKALELLFSVRGFDVRTAAGPEEALAAVRGGSVGLVFQDMNFSEATTTGEEGAALFRALRAADPGLPIVLMTAWTSLEMAVALVKEGAADYIAKPWDDEALLRTARNLLAARASEADGGEVDLCGLVYESARMKSVVDLAVKVARSDVSVLVTGPNGAGKEKIAEIVQANSPRREGPWVKVNVGALPDELLEAELFGAEAGAFTGAKRLRLGRFEAADGGTLFLDEIGNLSPAGQAKLLRVLQTGELQRLPDRLSDGPAGVQRRTGVLEHDPELAAHRAQLLGAYPDHVLACNAKASLRDRYEAHDGARNGRLA